MIKYSFIYLIIICLYIFYCFTYYIQFFLKSIEYPFQSVYGIQFSWSGYLGIYQST
jgi:hypothetical protein